MAAKPDPLQFNQIAAPAVAWAMLKRLSPAWHPPPATVAAWFVMLVAGAFAYRTNEFRITSYALFSAGGLGFAYKRAHAKEFLPGSSVAISEQETLVSRGTEQEYLPWSKVSRVVIDKRLTLLLVGPGKFVPVPTADLDPVASALVRDQAGRNAGAT